MFKHQAIENNKTRNTPCENCREQRRKCKRLVEDSSMCERCQSLNLKCIFKLIEKPKIIYTRMAPLPKRIKLMSSIEKLNQQLEKLELELNEIAEYNENMCHCDSVVPCKHMKLLKNDTTNNDNNNNNRKYTYTITYKQGKQQQQQQKQHDQKQSITFHASIRSYSDLTQFLTETMQAFYNQLEATPSPSTLPYNNPHPHPHTIFTFFDQLNIKNNQIVINLTFRNFKDQAVFFRLLKMDLAPPQYELARKSSLVEFNDAYYLECKRDMISVYFQCFNAINPILIRSYYYPHLMKNSSSLLATSIVAAVTLSSCQHITHKKDAKRISETARQEARALLNETLFNTVDLDTCLALFHMGVYEIYRLCSRLARVYSNLCWRMLQELKADFIPILQHPHRHPEESQIRAETWKRLYYFGLYVEANLCNVHHLQTDFLRLQEDGIDLFPKRLVFETDNETSVICMHFLAKLFVSTSKQDLVWFKFASGNMERVSITIIRELENTLYQLWLEIPLPLRIGNGPFEYITPFTSRAAWTDPAVLRLNQMYYVFWLTVQTRIMSYPGDEGHVIGHRALVIASICSDTLTKLFYYMNLHNPCGIDTHWTTMIMEVLDLLTTCPQPEIRQRARLNRKIMRQVIDSVLTHVPCAPFFEISHYELCILYNNKKIIE